MAFTIATAACAALARLAPSSFVTSARFSEAASSTSSQDSMAARAQSINSGNFSVRSCFSLQRHISAAGKNRHFRRLPQLSYQVIDARPVLLSHVEQSAPNREANLFPATTRKPNVNKTGSGFSHRRLNSDLSWAKTDVSLCLCHMGPEPASGEDEDDASEDEDQPLWMEEDDPSWPDDDPSGEGVGFRVSDFFEPKIMNEDGSPVDEELSLDWEAEQYQWVVKEITSIEWNKIAHEDPTPLILFAFERYGPRGADCWKLLEELEKVVRTIVNSRKYPIRAVKLDVNSEPDVGTALEIKTVPALLFIKGGKLLYRQYGFKIEQELLAITSHLFYHSARPDCMDELDTSHKVTSISSSG